MQAIRIKDHSQLVAVQRLRTQLAEKDQIKRQAKKNVLRRLPTFYQARYVSIIWQKLLSAHRAV